jgi:hypothetical protein
MFNAVKVMRIATGEDGDAAADHDGKDARGRQPRQGCETGGAEIELTQGVGAGVGADEFREPRPSDNVHRRRTSRANGATPWPKRICLDLRL